MQHPAHTITAEEWQFSLPLQTTQIQRSLATAILVHSDGHPRGNNKTKKTGQFQSTTQWRQRLSQSVMTCKDSQKIIHYPADISNKRCYIRNSTTKNKGLLIHNRIPSMLTNIPRRLGETAKSRIGTTASFVHSSGDLEPEYLRARPSNEELVHFKCDTIDSPDVSERMRVRECVSA